MIIFLRAFLVKEMQRFAYGYYFFCLQHRQPDTPLIEISTKHLQTLQVHFKNVILSGAIFYDIYVQYTLYYTIYDNI